MSISGITCTLFDMRVTLIVLPFDDEYFDVRILHMSF